MTYVWIEVLLLAKLAKGPTHGYELRRDVSETTGRELSNNSLYPTLRRFAEAGAVVRTAEVQEGRPARQVYTITDVGRELLHDLLADLPADRAADTAEFMARLAHFGALSPAERLGVLDARDRALARDHDRLAALAAAQDEPWSRLVLDEMCQRFRAEREWLAKLRMTASGED